MKFLGCPYPIIRHPNGLMHTQGGIEQIKSDMLCLLLTNPGERVMLPTFGTPLKRLIFDPNDLALVDRARQMILQAIAEWEPRITVRHVEVTNGIDEDSLDPTDPMEDVEHILSIRIVFVDPQDIQSVQELKLEVPLSEG